MKILKKPFLNQLLTKLRDKKTPYYVFRQTLKKMGIFMAYEIANDLEYREIKIRTPLSEASGFAMADNVVLIAILRAALPFVEGFLEVFEQARIGIVAARRIENQKSLEFNVEIEYKNIPEIIDNIVIIPDPMLATGSTILATLRELFKMGWPRKTIVCSVIATKYGIDRILSKYPQIIIYTASIDKELNSKGYIIPGLGDAGDRAFGTL